MKILTGWKCENCGLVVKEIKPWKKDECPEDVYDHEFVKIKKKAEGIERGKAVIFPPRRTDVEPCSFPANSGVGKKT